MATKAKSKSKEKKSAAKKKSAPKQRKVSLVRSAGESKSSIGHNSGKVNKPLVQLFEDFAHLDEQKKEISKAQRDIRSRAKEEFGVQSSVFNHEVKLRKMDTDMRVQFETGHKDLKDSLGYQFALELAANDEETEEQEENESGDAEGENEPEYGNAEDEGEQEETEEYAA